SPPPGAPGDAQPPSPSPATRSATRPAIGPRTRPRPAAERGGTGRRIARGARMGSFFVLLPVGASASGAPMVISVHRKLQVAGAAGLLAPRTMRAVADSSQTDIG